MRGQRWEVDTLRMIKIYGSAVVIETMRLIDVEIVLINNLAELFAQTFAHGASEVGLARPTSSCDT